MTRRAHKPKRVRELETQLRNEHNPKKRDELIAALEDIAEQQAEAKEGGTR